jgi:hypothetical protein
MFNDIINFDISYQSLERYPDMKYVIRNDTDEAIGVVGKDFKAASHPEFFGKIRETWQELLPDLADDVQITNKVSRNGAWALEQVIFPKAKTIIETDKHSTEIACLSTGMASMDRVATTVSWGRLISSARTV